MEQENNYEHEKTHYHEHRHRHHHDEHSHSHHHHNHEITSLNKTFIICIIINLLFVGIEATIGYIYNSISLISDAGHNLSDVFSLILALIAFKLSHIRANNHYTYGYKKSTILVSLFNAIILLIAIGFILYESVEKFRTIHIIDGDAISITAGIGIVVNGITAWLLMKNQKNDLNVRGAYLHMVADAIVSVGVVISGLIISHTGLYIIDPIISIIIAIIILISTWQLLSESIRLSLDGIPQNIHLQDISNTFKQQKNVCGYHHIHIWAISTTDTALTAHVVIDDIAEMENVKQELKKTLKEQGISHTTLEFEIEGSHCLDDKC